MGSYQYTCYGVEWRKTKEIKDLLNVEVPTLFHQLLAEQLKVVHVIFFLILLAAFLIFWSITIEVVMMFLFELWAKGIS